MESVAAVRTVNAVNQPRAIERNHSCEMAAAAGGLPEGSVICGRANGTRDDRFSVCTGVVR
ncbi:hypothetical protein ACSTG6_23495, partial [Vibrio parahaemolyticus]